MNDACRAVAQIRGIYIYIYMYYDDGDKFTKLAIYNIIAGRYWMLNPQGKFTIPHRPLYRKMNSILKYRRFSVFNKSGCLERGGGGENRGFDLNRLQV